MSFDPDAIERYKNAGFEMAMFGMLVLLMIVLFVGAALDDGYTPMEIVEGAAFLLAVIIGVVAGGYFLMMGMAVGIGYITLELLPRIERWRK